MNIFRRMDAPSWPSESELRMVAASTVLGHIETACLGCTVGCRRAVARTAMLGHIESLEVPLISADESQAMARVAQEVCSLSRIDLEYIEQFTDLEHPER